MSQWVGSTPSFQPAACGYVEMMRRGSAIERASGLARSSQCRSVSEITRRLTLQDGEAVEAHISEPAAISELILLCSDAVAVASAKEKAR